MTIVKKADTQVLVDLCNTVKSAVSLPSGQTFPTVDTISLTKRFPTPATLKSLQACVNNMESKFSNNCNCLVNTDCCQSCQAPACQACQSASCQSCQACQYCQGCQSQCSQCWS